MGKREVKGEMRNGAEILDRLYFGVLRERGGSSFE
jgi:hypothetical protein